MKTTNVIERLCLFLFALVLTMPTWAQGGSGNESETITIASKEDWKAFCNRVNSGQTTLNAKLTKDVDLGEEIVMAGTEDPNSPGYDFLCYTGTFDGQGHTLKFNWNAGKDDRIAPFKYVKDATIKNLRTQGKITTKGDCSSGMVYGAFGTTTLTGCISDVDITGGSGSDASRAAGMVQAVARDASVHITDCLVKGSITDNSDESERYMAGFVSYNNGTYTLTRCLYVGTNNAPNYSYTFGTEKGYGATFTDCYYLNTCGKAQGEQVTAERLKSGEMAKLLQGDRTENVWGQTLGTDLEPLPTADATKRVYQVKFVYNGEVKATRYATNGQSIHGGMPTFTAKDLLGTGYNPHHYYAIAFEGGFNASTPVNADRKVDITLAEKDCYEIASKDNWKEFRSIVGNGQNAVDAKMTADVNLGSDIFMVGNHYSGTFDGQGHTLTINWNGGSDSDIAPFYTVDGATIKNLRTEGKINSSTHFLSGLICNAYGTITLTNCVSNVNITSSILISACDAAGMIYSVKPGANVTIDDCVVKGNITATTDIGKDKMAGFVGSQEGTCTLNNCLYLGSSNGDTFSRTFVGDASYGATTTLTNCYYLNACGEAQGTQVTKEQLKSGEVAKMLQADRTDQCHWAQALGEEPSPYREADKAEANYVYYNKENNSWVCDDFRLTDGQPLPIGLDFTATKASYERDLSTAKATLCLPYELSVQGFKAYTISGGNNSAVYFAEAKDKLEAYKPYLITVDGVPQLGGENIEVKALNDDKLTTPAGKYKFVGTVIGMDNATAAAANAYILQTDGMFHKVTTEHSEAMLPAYRAYIQRNDSGAKQLSIVIDGETTGIGGATNDARGRADGPVYDLQGRRVADRLDDAARHRLPAGVYIVGGRKVIVK